MPIDVVTSFISAIERMDLDHALTHLTDDCEYDNVPMGKVFGRYEEVEWVIVQQAASGTLDEGVVFNERVDRFRAGDRWVEIPLAGVFKIRHGQISLWRDYFDRDMLLQAIAPPA
jgi:limonene-1,2-epoxide hydrolase